MNEIIYRAARADDLPQAIELFYVSLADVYARNNIQFPLPPRAAVEANYRHIFETGIFRVAETGDRLVAISHAVVRDALWFLSGFWALPELQGRGVGSPLLRETWREGERLGARTFFVWSSIDATAIASYLKLGMLPGFPLFNFAGTPNALPHAPVDYNVEPLSLETAASLDATVRGARREVDHRFWLAQSSIVAREVVRDGRAVGYFYVADGAVGAAAWRDARDAEAVLTLACREAFARTGKIMLRAPGVNHAAIRFALGVGLRFASFSHFFTNAPFGRLDQYLPSGPSLF
jgi:GNAT superfamily N-acetyltransferase